MKALEVGNNKGIPYKEKLSYPASFFFFLTASKFKTHFFNAHSSSIGEQGPGPLHCGERALTGEREQSKKQEIQKQGLNLTSDCLSLHFNCVSVS